MSSAILLYKMKSLFFSQKTKIFKKHKPVSFKFCTNFSAIKYNSFILFLAQALHTFVKSSLLKCKFLGFSSARVKIRQIRQIPRSFRPGILKRYVLNPPPMRMFFFLLEQPKQMKIMQVYSWLPTCSFVIRSCSKSLIIFNIFIKKQKMYIDNLNCFFFGC